MIIQENIPLKDFTTFRLGGPASFFCEAKSFADLTHAIRFAQEKGIPWFVLGGGSNMLVRDGGFPGLCIKNNFRGVFVNEKGDDVFLTVGAGENFDEVVHFSVMRGLYGLENLSHIPGNVGAAPVQNIGAYGVEISTIIESLEVFNTETLAPEIFLPKQCLFSYRDSIFKKPEGKKYIITKVIFKLKKSSELNLAYKDIKDFYEKNTEHPKSLAAVREAVISIRKNKLPDWKVIGTAGSFFKNPVITIEHYRELQKQYPEIPSYPFNKANVKIPLAWVLDKVCNIKKIKRKKVGVYENQALVIVAEKGATASEVLFFVEDIKNIVKKKTGISIEGEVVII